MEERVLGAGNVCEEEYCLKGKEAEEDWKERFSREHEVVM